MTEAQVIEDHVRAAAHIVKEIATSGQCPADMTPVQHVGSMLAIFVGKSLDDFLKTDERVRTLFKGAAVLVSKRYDNIERLYLFLKHAAGHLQKGAAMPKVQLGRICVFLTALFDRNQAAVLRKTMVFG